MQVHVKNKKHASSRKVWVKNMKRKVTGSGNQEPGSRIQEAGTRKYGSRNIQSKMKHGLAENNRAWRKQNATRNLRRKI